MANYHAKYSKSIFYIYYIEMLNLSNYLKKYSTINSKFIDDFFGLHEYKIDLCDSLYTYSLEFPNNLS